MKFVQLFLSVLIIIFVPHHGFAKDYEAMWSFTDHPHPGVSEMSLKEKLSLLSTKKRSPNGDISCRASLQTEYEIYLDRYPAYFAAFDEPDRFKQWKHHMAQNPAVQDLTCLYGIIEFRISKLNKSDTIGDDFLFCNGRYTRQPSTVHEQELMNLVNELIEYAHYGSERAALMFAGISAYSNIIKIGAELDYYFLSLAHAKNPSKSLSRRSQAMAEIITPKRLELLDNAVRDKTYAKVVESQPLCTF